MYYILHVQWNGRLIFLRRLIDDNYMQLKMPDYSQNISANKTVTPDRSGHALLWKFD